MVFTGRAIYDTGVFQGVAEDVSAIISMVSPHETPTLDRLAQAERPAASVKHEWLEDDLGPDTIIATETIDDAQSTLTVASEAGASVTAFLQEGMQIQTPSGEYIQITAIVGDIITVVRSFGFTASDTIAAGAELFIIGDAALEGEDVQKDTSRPRARQENFVQIFKKDVIVSGTEGAVTHLGGVTNEFDYQRGQRTRELLRDLNKTVIRGRSSGNTIGSATNRRTMKGLLQFLATNVATSVGTLTPSGLDDIIKLAWDRGGTDLDLIIADQNFRRQINLFNDTRVEVSNQEGRFRNKVMIYEGTYGAMEVILDRWMPANTLAVISTRRVRLVPLQNRSFTYKPASRTGDSDRGFIVGEYTLMVRNEEAMVQAFN